MNIITMYEQKYINLDTFIEEFPDHVSESQECIFGVECIKFYVDLVLGKNNNLFFISKYNS